MYAQYRLLLNFLFLIAAGSLNQNASDKNWRNRRSQKLDKMELLNLQSSLQSEIQAKAAISEELSRIRADLVAAQKYVHKINIADLNFQILVFKIIKRIMNHNLPNINSLLLFYFVVVYIEIYVRPDNVTIQLALI